MDRKQARHEAVVSSIDRIRGILEPGIDIPAMEQAKLELMSLCERKDLFPRVDFPVPADEVDRTYLVYQDDDGQYALYVNSSLPGQQSEPHDHGVSWAIVAAIEGEERHRLYRSEATDGSDLRQVSELVVRPGNAVSLLPRGIHAIEANGDQPLLHLHLYGASFDTQEERRQFDSETGKVKTFVLEDVGFVADAR